MDVSGPCLVVVKDGQPFNKYELIAEDKQFHLGGSFWISYYFNTIEDADLYLLFLIQEIGRKTLNQQINSKRTVDRTSLIEFRKTLDFKTLQDKVKGIDFIKEVKFVKWSKRIDNE